MKPSFSVRAIALNDATAGAVVAFPRSGILYFGVVCASQGYRFVFQVSRDLRRLQINDLPGVLLEYPSAAIEFDPACEASTYGAWPDQPTEHIGLIGDVPIAYIRANGKETLWNLQSGSLMPNDTDGTDAIWFMKYKIVMPGLGSQKVLFER